MVLDAREGTHGIPSSRLQALTPGRRRPARAAATTRVLVAPSFLQRLQHAPAAGRGAFRWRPDPTGVRSWQRAFLEHPANIAARCCTEDGRYLVVGSSGSCYLVAGGPRRRLSARAVRVGRGKTIRGEKLDGTSSSITVTPSCFVVVVPRQKEGWKWSTRREERFILQ